MNTLLLGLVSVGFLLALCGSVRGSCQPGELMCDDGQCISSGLWCDDNEDCSDQSDEAYCKKKKWYNPNPNGCKESHFLCADGRCIPLNAKCNDYSDCKDGSDEDDCEGSQSKEDSQSKENGGSKQDELYLSENDYDEDRVPTTQATPNSQETSWKGEEEDEYEELPTSSDPGPNYPLVGVTEEEEELNYTPPTVTSAETTTQPETFTMDYYQRKATQSTHKTYAPEHHHTDALRYDIPTQETYVTRPTQSEGDSRKPPVVPSLRTTSSYPPPTADPRTRPNSQRPPYSYTQSAPYPHRPLTQRPPHSYTQHNSPHSSPPPYSQRPPNSYLQPTSYDHRQPGSYPQPTSYDHRQPGSYPQPSSYDYRQRASYPQSTSYDHRQPGSYPQPTSYDRRKPAPYPYREPHSHHPYTNPSSHPSYQNRQDPRTQEVQPWSDTRLAPSVYTGRRKVPSRLHFPKNYTQIHERDNGGPVRRGKEWLIGLRESSGGWGANTSRALVALALVNNDFVEGSHENDLMKKYFKVHLGVKLLSPGEIGPNQLAGYVNALLASCQDPRDFHGTNIVRLLKDKVQGAHHGDPFVLLSLCLVDEDLSTHQVYSLMRTLGGYLPRSERGKDLLSLSISAFACHLQRYVASTHTDSNYAQSLRSALRNGTFSLLQLQLDDGSFGSVYSTALAAQALMSVNDSLNWDPNPTFRFLRDHQTRDGSFGDFLSTYLALPALSGRSLLHLTTIRCHEEAPPEDLTPQEILTYRGPKQYIRYSLQFGSPLTNTYSVEVAVPHGINFFDVMRVADFQNKHFNFRYEKENTRIHVYSISDVPNDVERGLTWQLYVRRNSETGVPRRNEAYNGDIRELLTTADQHYVFWYRPYNL